MSRATRFFDETKNSHVAVIGTGVSNHDVIKLFLAKGYCQTCGYFRTFKRRNHTYLYYRNGRHLPQTNTKARTFAVLNKKAT